MLPFKKVSGSSKVANRFQSLAEDDWTTVGNSKPPASPTSYYAKDSKTPSTYTNQANVGVKRLDLNWRLPPQNRPGRQSTVSRQTPRSTAGDSRVSYHRDHAGQNRLHQFFKNSPPNPNIRKLFGKDFFRPGLIIRADLHQEDYKTAKSAITAPKTITAPNGTIEVSAKERANIHTKERKMIVVACYERHYMCIPLYSHEGYGLKNKNEDEYISVRDHRVPLSEFRPLSAHGALTTEYLHEGIEPYHPMTAAHITYPVSRSYELAVIHEGSLKPADLDLLADLFNRYAPKRA
ncbi:MAG: hypothetical protein Q9195_003513 [Heterodermia aff. obscurata]